MQQKLVQELSGALKDGVLERVCIGRRSVRLEFVVNGMQSEVASVLAMCSFQAQVKPSDRAKTGNTETPADGGLLLPFVGESLAYVEEECDFPSKWVFNSGGTITFSSNRDGLESMVATWPGSLATPFI